MVGAGPGRGWQASLYLGEGGANGRLRVARPAGEEGGVGKEGHEDSRVERKKMRSQVVRYGRPSNDAAELIIAAQEWPQIGCS